MENLEKQLKAERKYLPVKFVHEKNPQFKTYHADGTWGMVNSLGEIQLNFYTEFPTIVTGSIHEVNPQTGLYTGKMEMQGLDESKNLITRDFQCCVVVSLSVAEQIQKSLGVFIENAKTTVAEMAALIERAEKNQ
jgi:hypothetical protein